MGLPRISLLLTGSLYAACQRPALVIGDTGFEEDEDIPIVETDPATDLQILARLSLDLRGTRPSLDEIEAVQADPEALSSLASEFVSDQAFPARMAWLWNDTLHTAVFGSSYYRFDGWSTTHWKAVGQEPLKMIEQTIAEGSSFGQVVSSSQTMVDGTLADLWNLDVDLDPGEWAWASYDDGRPMAGILSSNTLWLRYAADAVNYNRTRANTVARIFLCADFLDREASFRFDIDAESLASIEQAVSTEPACLTCHASLDPLASFFGGFAEKSAELPVDELVVFSHHNADWFSARQKPAYFGQPATDMADLGALVAEDPRFSSCVVQRFYQGLVGSEIEDAAALGALVQDFREQDLRVAPLVEDIVASAAYREDRSRVLTTEQLYTVLRDLLGVDEEESISAGLEPLLWSTEHRLLGGGTDDDTVLLRNLSHGIGNQLLGAWMGRRAAESVIEDLGRDLADRHILDVQGIDESSPETDRVKEQLARLHARFTTLPVEVDSQEVDRLFELWQAAWEAGDTESAWCEVIAALIRHPAMGIY